MLVLMCSVGVKAQNILTVNSGVTYPITSSGNGISGFGGNVWDAIIVEANGILDVQPGAVLEFDFMDVEQLGTVTVDRAALNLTGGNGRISLAAGGSANYGATLEMTNSQVYSSAGIWDGIFVAGWGGSSSLNLQRDRFVAKAKLDDCQITGSRFGICNYEQFNAGSTGGGIIQATRCFFAQNGVALDFREALYTPSGITDIDSSYAILSTFRDNGFSQGSPSTPLHCAIYASEINGPQVLGNTFSFSGNITNPAFPVYGVVHDGAGTRVTSHCSGNTVSTTSNCANGTLTPNRFENLTGGVFRYLNAPQSIDLKVTVSGCFFTNCVTGVYADQNERVTITGNIISMRQPNPANPVQLTGIEVSNCASFTLNTNGINVTDATAAAASTSQGIYVRDMPSFTTPFPNGVPGGEKIEYNSITNCSIAISLSNNEVTGDDGLLILCNYMNNIVPSARDIVSVPGTALPVTQYGISNQNGHYLSTGGYAAAGNTFTSFSNVPNPQNFVYTGRTVNYYYNGSTPPAGFSAGVTFTAVGGFNCNPPGLPPAARFAPDNQATDKLVSAAEQEQTISPNPSSNGLYKLNGFGVGNYVVTDMFGRKLVTGSLTDGVNTLDLSALAAGTYMFTVKSEGQPATTYRLVRQ